MGCRRWGCAQEVGHNVSTALRSKFYTLRCLRPMDGPVPKAATRTPILDLSRETQEPPANLCCLAAAGYGTGGLGTVPSASAPGVGGGGGGGGGSGGTPQQRLVAERRWRLGVHARGHPSALMAELYRVLQVGTPGGKAE